MFTAKRISVTRRLATLTVTTTASLIYPHHLQILQLIMTGLPALLVTGTSNNNLKILPSPSLSPPHLSLLLLPGVPPSINLVVDSKYSSQQVRLQEDCVIQLYQASC